MTAPGNKFAASWYVLAIEFPLPGPGGVKIFEQTGALHENKVDGNVDDNKIPEGWPSQTPELGPGVVYKSGSGLTVRTIGIGVAGAQVPMLGVT